MSYALVIVESPAKCGKIQGFLGPGWKVVATMGHIRALEESLDAIGLQNDFQLRYTFIKDKTKGLRDAASGARQIFLASDDDREGEAISFSVAALLNLNVETTPRIVFHEITEKAIKEAIQNPRRLNMARVEAQQARAVLDMMVGFTISPVLWKFVGPSLSAGRCQTSALRLLVDREREIGNFVSSNSWKISGDWSHPSMDFEASLHDRLEDEDSATAFLENIHDTAEATITSTKTVKRFESAPLPYITSTLQQDASALFGFPLKVTMSAAQKLYEQGYITYMRTDSTVLSEEAVTEGQAYITQTFGAPFVGAVKGAKVKVAGAQEAHEAIRPTHFTTESVPESMDSTAVKLYRLIWQRATQSLMSACQIEEHLVLFTAKGDPDGFVWRSQWRRTVFAGWKQVALSRVNHDEVDGDEEKESSKLVWAKATALKVGEIIRWKRLAAMPESTRAASRYTEATLVRELEKKGIGRPSTFASLVATVLEKTYAKKADIPAREMELVWYSVTQVGVWPPQRMTTKKKTSAEKGRLIPTELGTTVLDFCVSKFSQLFDYGFTKQMELRLDQIASGAEPWKRVCEDTWNSYKGTLAQLKEEKATKAVGEEIEMGEYKGDKIFKKKGPYGWYCRWGSVNVTIDATDTLAQIIEKVEKKSTAYEYRLGPYEFRKGPYGMYMFKKTTGKGKPKFVSLPEALDPKTLTEQAAARIYENDLQQKKKKPAK